MSWRIEYTNHPWLKKKRKKILEKAVAEAIGDIENRLKMVGEDEWLERILGDTDFVVELEYLRSSKKYHIAIRDLKRDEDWVATIVLEDQPTMTVEEVKDTLRKLGFNEYSLYALGVTNEKTVSGLMAELEEKMRSHNRDELLKKIDLANLKFLEGFLEQGIIKPSDSLLDAIRKIDRTLSSK